MPLVPWLPASTRSGVSAYIAAKTISETRCDISWLE